MSKRGLVVKLPTTGISSEPILDPHFLEMGTQRLSFGLPKPRILAEKSQGFPICSIRRWLMYWDELAIPKPYAPIWHTSDEEYLLEAGFIKVIETPEDADYRGAQIRLWQELEKLEPGLWCLASEEPVPRVETPEKSNIGRANLIRLYNVLPIPLGTVPFSEILNFKRTRREELTQLRVTLEEMYQVIASSEDQAAATQTEIDKLLLAVGQVVRVAKEAGLEIRFGGIEARVKWEFDLQWGAVGAIGGSILLESPVGAVIGAALGAAPKLEFSSVAALECVSPRSTPFEYVALASREFGGLG
ncbi:hypothetical protein K3740_06680 [Ruegeria conchae]|uniref:DUF6236 family protein n=1 Tax=Ruegeria conchae TaxID=981384 RepID=UPI0021A4789B|nr:DUF6236 family protein [Ruegeria conchae]UWR04361.1 hypothetical protein K3740_06680 [Ruegeria conchae]